MGSASDRPESGHEGPQTAFRIIDGPAASCNRPQKNAAFSGNLLRLPGKTFAQSRDTTKAAIQLA
jgi:hypothetical protein